MHSAYDDEEVSSSAFYKRTLHCTSASSTPASTAETLTSLDSEHGELVRKKSSFKKLMSKFSNSNSCGKKQGDADNPPKPKSKSSGFGVKSLLRSFTFSKEEMQLLTMDKRELEAMKRFGVDRETYRSVQATELDRYVRVEDGEAVDVGLGCCVSHALCTLCVGHHVWWCAMTATCMVVCNDSHMYGGVVVQCVSNHVDLDKDNDITSAPPTPTDIRRLAGVA